MKIFLKNKFLKIASLLVVVFLITTCVIGTTFAKYTTGASGSDSARIAKWGIEVSASGSLFGKNYGSSHTIVASDDTVPQPKTMPPHLQYRPTNHFRYH